MEQCVKISQTFSTLITRKLQMIINGLESISIFAISYCMKKKRFHLPHQFNKEYYESIEDF